MFAESAGKKGGDFYTPRDVIRLMVRLLKPTPGMSVYDPTCGSGGMLIISREYIEQSGGDVSNLRVCGRLPVSSRGRLLAQGQIGRRWIKQGKKISRKAVTNAKEDKASDSLVKAPNWICDSLDDFQRFANSTDWTTSGTLAVQSRAPIIAFFRNAM